MRLTMCFYFSLQRNWFLKRPALGFWMNDKENIQVLTKGEHRQNRLRALPCYLLSVDKDLSCLGHTVSQGLSETQRWRSGLYSSRMYRKKINICNSQSSIKSASLLTFSFSLLLFQGLQLEHPCFWHDRALVALWCIEKQSHLWRVEHILRNDSIAYFIGRNRTFTKTSFLV